MSVSENMFTFAAKITYMNKALEQIDIDARNKKTGRPTDPQMQKDIIECIQSGLSYAPAQQVLIKKGYVSYGRCTVTKNQYEYVRKKYSGTKVLRIEMPKELAEYATSHSEEVIAFLRSRILSHTSL